MAGSLHLDSRVVRGISKMERLNSSAGSDRKRSYTGVA
jgi:hypothetical protein